MSLTFGSLFAGIGGIDLGLERAGLICKWQVEIDDYATRVLEKHWPNVQRYSDITRFLADCDCGQRELTNGAICSGRAASTGCCEQSRVELVAGGFPCQDISYAGRGAGLDGERSGLFFEALRVVRQLKPRYVLLENVAALLSRGLDRVCGELAAIGYDAEWHCIPAASVGAPHIRDRVFIIANSDSQRLERTELQRERFMQQQRLSDKSWWSTEPDVGRVANGVPNRVDRLRGLGNAVVPQVAEYIGRQILGAT